MDAWIIGLAVALPMLAYLLWLLVDDSLLRIPAGSIGLVLVRGRATGRALEPGPHFVPVFRRIMIQEYPSLVLTHRAGHTAPADGPGAALERSGPPLRLVLGDRATVEMSYTVRFRLVQERLRDVHEAFGSEGFWGAVRDRSATTVRRVVVDPGIGLDQLFGTARETTEAAVADALRAALEADGFELVLFAFEDLDLGRTGEVIQATVRARHEVEREQAEAESRRVRVEIDTELEPLLAGRSMDAALRYREVDVLRELAHGQVDRRLMLPTPRRHADEPRSGPDPSDAGDTGDGAPEPEES